MPFRCVLSQADDLPGLYTITTTEWGNQIHSVGDEQAVDVLGGACLRRRTRQVRSEPHLDSKQPWQCYIIHE